MAGLLVLGRLALAVLCLAATTKQACDDMDAKACQLMAVSNPNLCQDKVLAKTACPRFCHFCPMECYHCNTTLNDFHNCNTTKLCAEGEVCMQKVVTSIVDRHHAYQLTCERKDRCDGNDLTLAMGKRGLETRDVSIKCCLDDKCNYPERGCKKDVIVIVEAEDRSHVTGYDVEQFVGALVSQLSIGPGAVQLSLAEYDDDNHQTLWHLSSYPSNTSLKNAITNLHRRFNDRALEVTGNAFILAQKAAPDNRQDAPDILVTLTDDNNGGLNSRSVFEAYAGQFEQVLAVGVDRHDDREHHFASGYATSQGQQFVVKDHHMLVNAVSSIVARICPPPAV